MVWFMACWMNFLSFFALLLFCNFYSYSNNGDNLVSSYRLFPSFSLFIFFLHDVVFFSACNGNQFQSD